MPHRILFVTVSILLSVVTMETDAECRFPDFLVKLDPWVGDYKRGNQFLVAYIKTSNLTRNTGDELCDDKRMALDAFPLINSKEAKRKHITCPFVGEFITKFG
ncbi:hypothetical protein ElyMa_001671800 [Elysia marginata]|uniref:Uncharacterized protein n=1 Tax=Elysia marginata TaxID=1093978 RepID=A0AAV4JRQ8_9GAST|nr:hypothetical protein ElyMa_001671800 [Elysia marginata]